MTLFPFLAVLVCTMGILIVLLVIVTKLADDRAQQSEQLAAEKAQKQIEEIESAWEIEKMRVDGIRNMRAGLQEKLEQQRGIRSHVENDIRKLREQADQLKADYQLLTKRHDSVKLASHNRELNELKQQLEQTREKATLLKQQTQNRPRIYSLVPHSGQGEANRRPIYVECTRQGITLQPYGIKLTRKDFTRPVIAGNPFDSALLAIREYWIENGLVDNDTRPYPLLVIRPGGESNYGLARHALKTWEDQFGYELVETDKKLHFGETDEVLNGKIEQAILDAKKFQTQMAVALEREKLRSKQRIGSGRGRGGMRASPTGGFVSVGPRGTDGETSAFAGNHRSGLQPNGGPQQNGSANQTALSPRGLNKNNSQNSGRSPFANGNQFVANSSSGENQNQFSPTSPNSSPSSKSQPSLAAKRGKGWALPTRTQGATAYKRPIKLVCSQNEIALRANATTNQSYIRVPITDNYTQTVDRMVQKIWNIIESWDLAAARGYWKPELVFEVKPGAETHYRQIKRLLRDSGLDIKGPNE